MSLMVLRFDGSLRKERVTLRSNLPALPFTLLHNLHRLLLPGGLPRGREPLGPLFLDAHLTTGQSRAAVASVAEPWAMEGWKKQADKREAADAEEDSRSAARSHSNCKS